MKEGTLADDDERPEHSESNGGGFTAGPVFPALVALWFAVLFGGGCLFLPPVLFDMVFGGTSPFGPQTRIIAALAAAGVGLLIGLFVAFRVRSDDTASDRPTPERTSRKKRKRDARPPLDVRAALGLRDPDEDEDDDDLELSDEFEWQEADHDDEVRAPIDDPHFASAWSDSDAYDLEGSEDFDLVDASDVADVSENHVADQYPAPSPQRAPARVESRYNPFAERIGAENEAPADSRPFEAPRQEAPEPVAPVFDPEPAPLPTPNRTFESALAPSAPPPPPAWPQPRPEEPALGELGVAELVERLARALQGQENVAERPAQTDRAAFSASVDNHAPAPDNRAQEYQPAAQPTAYESDVDRALRLALDRLARLDDVA